MDIQFEKKTEKIVMLYYYLMTYKYIRKSGNASYIKKLQNKKLKRVLKAAYEIPLYRKKFDSVNLKPKDIKSVDELHKLPVLTKEEYRDWINEEIKCNPEKYEGWYSDHTSGSTGMPLHIKYTPYEHAAMMAKVFKVYMHNGHHIFLNSMMAIVAPTHSTSETRSFIQKLGLARKYKMSQLDRPEALVKKFNEVKPDLLNANMSHVISMVEYAENNHIVLHKPKVVISTAEKLSKEKYLLLKKHFGDAIVDVYGCIESGMIAYNCKDDINKKHFLNEYNYFFAMDENGKVSNNGKIYLTSLFQTGMPLINYNVGDVVECFEENGIKYIREIHGRQDDWIKFKDGTKLPFQHVYEIMSPIEGIVKFKVIQETYDLLKIKVVKIKQDIYDEVEIEKNILKNAHDILGESSIEIQIEWCEKIEVEENGKIRMLISKV